MEGTVLDGKFRLVRRIGEGGMGVVYEAEHVAIGRRVAVKVVQSELAQRPDVVSRFQREAQIAGRLGHDNICEVLDVGVTPQGAQYLVMPLLRGVSLAELIRRHGRLPIKQAIDISSQVLSALGAAHNAGVVHRDLKPDNVFITRVGDRADFVKLLDFGISKIFGDGPMPVSALTRTGAVMGTPYYMAPEQARGQKDQDHRVDLYATGVMLFEMLTGRRPYEGDSFNELLIKIVTEPFPPVRTLREDVPLVLDAFVSRAMARDREQRFPDALAMKTDLSAARVEVEEPTGRIRITVTGTDAGAVPSSGSQPVAPTPLGIALATGAPPPAAGSRRGLIFAAVLLVVGLAGVVVVNAQGGLDFLRQLAAGAIGAPHESQPESLVAGQARDVTGEVIVQVNASSALSRHPATHAFDGRSDTAWNEGAPGSGVGEWVEARLSRPVRVSYLAVAPGWDYIGPRTGADLFTANRRMSRFDVESAAGTRSFDVPDGVRLFHADMGGVSTSWLRIVVSAVQTGAAQYEDLCIGEIRIFEEGPAAQGMVRIEGGRFLMGTASGSADEGPAHDVDLRPYSIDRTEVRVRDYLECVRAGSCTWPETSGRCVNDEAGRGLHPVICVDWAQADSYCRWAGKRLPSEAEWELAARGTDGRTYPWGGDPPDCSRADFTPTGRAQHSCGGMGTSPVGSRPAGQSPFGLLDMAGNVWEWVMDFYSTSHYAEGPMANPVGPPRGATRVTRGGTWGSPANELTTTVRRALDPAARLPGVGFRCAQ